MIQYLPLALFFTFQFLLKRAGTARIARIKKLEEEFVCPKDCQECCASYNAKIFKSFEEFKCVLKTRGTSDIPDSLTNRGCKAIERRQSTWSQAKVKCRYTLSERKFKPWETLPKKCSRRTKCCCDKKEDWTEQLCLPFNYTQEQVQLKSPTSQVTEVYEKVDVGFENKNDCKGSGVVKKQYQTWRTNKAGRAVWTDRGCCVKVQDVPARHKWQSYEQTNTTCHNTTCHEWIIKYDYRTVTKCMEFERLYHCSGPGTTPEIGTTQTGNLYHRISTHKGICIGDAHGKLRLNRSKTGFYMCPTGMTSSAGAKWCKCDVECGL